MPGENGIITIHARRVFVFLFVIHNSLHFTGQCSGASRFKPGTEQTQRKQMKLAATIVAAIIAEATAVRSVKVEEASGKKSDPRQAAIQAIFDKDEPFGCHTGAAAELVSAITGLSVVSKTGDGSKVPQFHVVVPENNTSSQHRFTIGKPVIVLGIRNGAGMGIGENLGRSCYLRKSEVRPATDEEFKAAMDFIAENEARVYKFANETIGLAGIFPV